MKRKMEIRLTSKGAILSNSDKRFWTERVRLYFPIALNHHNATSSALLCTILKRGTVNHPDMLSLERALEERYGMAVGFDIAKLGDLLIFKATMQSPKSRFTPAGAKLQKEALALFSEILLQPLQGENGFFKDYFEQERRILIAQLTTLINHRELYSRIRFLNHFCRSEPYRLYEYGDIKTAETITNNDVYTFYRKLIEETPFILYTDGFDYTDVFDALKGLAKNSASLLPFKQKCLSARKRTKTVTERMDIKQAYLWFGFRANIPPTDERATAAQILSAIFGGLPTSRLFKSVREKSSLAYDVHSTYVRSKGIMAVHACVSPENLKKAKRLIMKEWERITSGDASEEELKTAKRYLIQDIETLVDSPLALADFYAYGILIGKNESLLKRIENIKKVKRDDIVAVARSLECDTVFSLIPDDKKRGRGQK